jgi:hypothetical protein
MRGADLQWLADRAAIEEVLVRYFHAVDHGSLAELESCFTADVHATYDGRVVGASRDELLEFFRGRRPNPTKSEFANLRHRMHFVSNITMSVQAEAACTETYAIAYLVDQPDELRLRTRALRYYDDLRWENGAWRICRRRHVVEWSKSEPADLLSVETWSGWR